MALRFFKDSALIAAKGLQSEAGNITWRDGLLDFSNVTMNSYYASVCAALIRSRLIAQHESFALETVMSSPDKLDLLRDALSEGFRTYLYFVTTSDPAQSVARVKYRVAEGGHDVPPEKIIARYTRSLENLSAAIRQTNRAYVFDNSGSVPELIAEITDGKRIKLHTDTAREWFQIYVLNRLPADG